MTEQQASEKHMSSCNNYMTGREAAAFNAGWMDARNRRYLHIIELVNGFLHDNKTLFEKNGMSKQYEQLCNEILKLVTEPSAIKWP
jgi:hypothetical protein